MKKSKEYVGIVLTFIVTLMLVGMISGTVKAENIRSGEYEYSLSSGAVSYTHLDVYKRQ